MPKRPRGRWLLRALAGGLALALAVIVTASVWVRVKTGPFSYRDAGQVPARDVAIVLGASVHRSGKPSPVAQHRLDAALGLLRTRKVQRILVSGDHRPDVYDETEAMGRWLSRAGVPNRQLILDRAGLRTFDSMVRAAHVFGVRRAIVCTQAFHLPRALFLARRAGIDAVGLEVGQGILGTGIRDLARESLATVRAVLDASWLGPAP